VLNTHWNGAALTEPTLLEPPTAPLRRLFQLEMIARGFYVAQRGMITLCLPMTEADIDAFVGEVREYLNRHADILPPIEEPI
jgi:glutamate-1-semialdehyde 2,1-aminomutase